MILIASTSLNPASRSRVLAHAMRNILSETAGEHGNRVELLDLQELTLPFCNANDCYGDPQVTAVAAQIASADAVLIAAPIYNFDLGAAAKNLLELTGKNSWQNKLVGFLLAAGGQGSYMSAMGFANSLMLDFRCLILPRFVYATEQAITDGKICDPEIQTRLQTLASDVVNLLPGWKAALERAAPQ